MNDPAPGPRPAADAARDGHGRTPFTFDSRACPTVAGARRPVGADGRAGLPAPMYQSALTNLLDELTVVGERVAVADIAFINGLGISRIALMGKQSLPGQRPQRICTGLVRASSLAVDPSTRYVPDDLIAGSAFEGGGRRYRMP